MLLYDMDAGYAGIVTLKVPATQIACVWAQAGAFFLKVSEIESGEDDDMLVLYALVPNTAAQAPPPLPQLPIVPLTPHKLFRLPTPDQGIMREKRRDCCATHGIVLGARNKLWLFS